MAVSRAWTRATTPPAASADLTTTTTAVAQAAPTGKVAPFCIATPPTGWIKANGQTIGNAASGATRANVDTLALFTALWTDTTLTITTSAGGASSRGANAAADWAANKRLAVPDLRGEFIRGLDDSRGVDSSRGLATAQAEMIGPHTHNISSDAMGSNPGTGVRPSTSTSGATPTALANTGTENRPRNVALAYFIKL